MATKLAVKAADRSEPAVIGRLRARSAIEPTPPTLSQLKLLRDSLAQNQTLDHTARLLGCGTDETLRLIIEVGTWLRQSNRVPLPTLVEGDSLQLFNLPKAPRRGAWEVVVPAGYLRAGGKVIRRPLAALLVVHPDDQQLERWMARTYTASLPLLTFPVVAAVWRMATMGMLDKLEQVSPSARFAKVAVEAWELLEFARRDAVDAIGQLTIPALEVARRPLTDERREAFADKVAGLARTASWLSEQDLARVSRMAQEAKARPDAQQLLASELRHLRQRRDSHPGVYRIGHIGQIREGQMLRICQAAGLPTDPPDSARVAELRSRIKALGLEGDADQLTPNAVVADQVGVIDEFMAAVKARADGREDWLEQMLQLAHIPRR
jgi:hypothetical protein